MKRKFPVPVIISVYHHRMLCDFADYREFLDYMCGAHLYFHDIARGRTAVAENLPTQLRGLAATSKPPEKNDSGAGGRYIKLVTKELGGQAEFDLKPLPAGTFQPISIADSLK